VRVPLTVSYGWEQMREGLTDVCEEMCTDLTFADPKLIIEVLMLLGVQNK